MLTLIYLVASRQRNVNDDLIMALALMDFVMLMMILAVVATHLESI